MTVLAVFRSRTQTMAFCAAMRSAGYFVNTVNTPKEANVGCGLSAAFDPSFLPWARREVCYGNYSAFVGFYATGTHYGKRVVERL